MLCWLFRVLSLGLVVFATSSLRAAEAAPADPDAESATHRELAPLDVKFKRLSSLRLHPNGNLLAGDSEARQIKVIDVAGHQVETIELEFGPESIAVASDGTIYTGGEGRVAMLSAEGEVIKTVRVPEKQKAAAPDSARPARTRPQRVSGLAVSDDEIFVAFGSSWSLRSLSKLFRFDRDLENPKFLKEGIRGCCQRCDIAIRDGKIYIAENARFRVLVCDRDGTELAKWGSHTRQGQEGFGTCCNPMNLCFDAAGSIYTSESGLGRVKRFSPDGRLLDLVGYVGTTRFVKASGLAAACSNIAIAVTPKADRVYVMDYKNNLVRVLQRKSG